MIALPRLSALAFVAFWPAMAGAVDPRSDAPEDRIATALATTAPPTYEAALRTWRSADEVNAWIGASFAYDDARALRLSETQRAHARPAIHDPEAFYLAPSGVCVDLARFGVETLRAIDPAAKPVYLMIEFAPITLAGNVLRRHWLAAFERDGARYFFADAKRPGVLAGPYASTQAFIDDYAAYRGRGIVAFHEVPGYERAARTLAAKRVRDERVAE